MKVHYTGRDIEITDREKKKLQGKFEKIHRILSAGRNLEAHVTLKRQRHRCEVEVTLRALQHTLVVSEVNAHPFTALSAAVDKLEQQAVRNKHKLIEVRRNRMRAARTMPEQDREKAPAPSGDSAPRIIRSNTIHPKPLTVEGACIQLEESENDQITFRDADNGAIRVLLRRRDGALELVEI